MKECVVLNIKITHTLKSTTFNCPLLLNASLEFSKFQLLLLFKGSPCLKSLKLPFGMECVDEVKLVNFKSSKHSYYFVLSKDKEGEKQFNGTKPTLT